MMPKITDAMKKTQIELERVEGGAVSDRVVM